MRVVSGLLSADRCDARPLPQVRSAVGRAGLAFEKHVGTALRAHKVRIEHNPWFRFRDRNGQGQIVPDYLVWVDWMDALFVIECKLKFPPLAPIKVQRLYVPVLEKALNRSVVPLVVCKFLTPEAHLTVDSISKALEYTTAVPTLQWLQRGDIPW